MLNFSALACLNWRSASVSSHCLYLLLLSSVNRKSQYRSQRIQMSYERLLSTCPTWGRTTPRAASTAFSSTSQGKNENKACLYSCPLKGLHTQGRVRYSNVLKRSVVNVVAMETSLHDVIRVCLMLRTLSDRIHDIITSAICSQYCSALAEHQNRENQLDLDNCPTK